MSQGYIFVYIQRCRSQCWLDKLCILFGNCLVEDNYLYLGSCETTFKDRFGNHKKSFNHLKHKNDMELSKEF